MQTRCDFDPATLLFKLGRVDRQTFGARFMVGLVSLGDVERYGLRAAALETKKGTYVAPSDASLDAAIALTTQQKPMEPFVLDQKDVRKSSKAYPGTMVVYTAARLANLLEEDATKVAQFIRLSTTEGQKVGSGNGELPAGLRADQGQRADGEALRVGPEGGDGRREADARSRPRPRRVPDATAPDGGGAGGGTSVPPAARPATPPSAAAPPPTRLVEPECLAERRADRDAGDPGGEQRLGRPHRAAA